MLAETWNEINEPDINKIVANDAFEKRTPFSTKPITLLTNSYLRVNISAYKVASIAKRNCGHLCKIVDNRKSPFFNLLLLCYGYKARTKRVRVIECKKHISNDKTWAVKTGKFIYCHCDNELFKLLEPFT